MTELVTAPKWFDNIYKELENSIRFNWGVSDAHVSAKSILLNAIAHQGFVSVWTDTVLEETRLPNSHLKKLIMENEEEKIEYVEKHRFDLIKAIIDGYEVEEDKYVVVSKNYKIEIAPKFQSYHIAPWKGTKIDEVFYGDAKKYYVYFENNGIEDCKSISENENNDLFNGVLTNELIPTMNQDEAESLLNDYRLKFKVK